MPRLTPVMILMLSYGWATPLHADVHTQTLASSCAACHGTNGNSVAKMPQLAGMDVDYFLKQMYAFKFGKEAPTVMHRHSAGLTPNEIEALAHYFSRQPIKPAAILNTQSFR